MSKIVLSDITNPQNDASVVSTTASNNDALETAIENTLSRDGTSPNEMRAELDMNSNRIINLPDPASDHEPVTKAYAVANFGVSGGLGNVARPSSTTNESLVRWEDSEGTTIGDTQVLVAVDGTMTLAAYGAGLLTTDADGVVSAVDQSTIIPTVFTGDTGTGGTTGLVPAPAAGDAAAVKYLKADGTWATVASSADSADFILRGPGPVDEDQLFKTVTHQNDTSNHLLPGGGWLMYNNRAAAGDFSSQEYVSYRGYNFSWDYTNDFIFPNGNVKVGEDYDWIERGQNVSFVSRNQLRAGRTLFDCTIVGGQITAVSPIGGWPAGYQPSQTGVQVSIFTFGNLPGTPETIHLDATIDGSGTMTGVSGLPVGTGFDSSAKPQIIADLPDVVGTRGVRLDLGPTLDLIRDCLSGDDGYWADANSQLGAVRFHGRTGTGNNAPSGWAMYGQIGVEVISGDPTDARGKIYFATPNATNGANGVAERLLIDQGIWTPFSNGGDKGLDTVNAKELWIDGEASISHDTVGGFLDAYTHSTHGWRLGVDDVPLVQLSGTTTYFLTDTSHSTWSDFTEVSSPVAPSANTIRMYAKDNGSGLTKIYAKDSAGTEYDLTASGGGGGSISGPATTTSTAIALWNATDGTALKDSGVLVDSSNNVTGVKTLKINNNVGSLPTAVTGAVVQAGGANSTNSKFVMETAAGSAGFTGRRSGNTLASPSGLASNDVITTLQAQGYGTTGYSANSRANVQLVANEAWTDTAQGTRIELQVTPNGSTTTGTVVTINNDGTLKLSGYGAGTLQTDASGNVSAGAGGTGGDTIGNRLAKTAAYTVLNSDRTKTIALSGSSFYTLTFGAASGYDANFWVDVLNEDTRNAKKIDLNGTTWRLWPGQRRRIFASNNVWWPQRPERWKVPSGNQIVYVKPSTGSDTNDGTSGFEFANTYKAMEMVENEWDLKSGGNYVYFTVRSGETDTAGVHIAEQAFANADGLLGIVICGETGGTKPIIATTGVEPISLHNGCHVQIQDIKLNAPSGYCSIVAQRAARCTLGDNVEFGAAAGGGVHIYAFSGANVEIAGAVTISGSATNFVSTLGSGTRLWVTSGSSINFSTNCTFTTFAVAQDLSYQYWGGATINLNAHTITGSRYNVSGGANIQVVGGGASYLPGNSAGVNSSGYYDNAQVTQNNTVTNAALATMATASFKGRATAGTGNVEDLSATSATALLNAFVGDSGSGGTKGLVPAPATGDATKFLKGDGTWGSPAGAGTVTSVGLSMPAIFSVSGSPVTGSGTLTASLATQSANLVWSGPASGSAAAPGFRSLVAADIPLLLRNANTAAPPAAVTNTTAHIAGADATNNILLLDGFGATGRFSFRAAAGTAASPTGLGSATLMGQLNAYGRDSSGVYSSTPQVGIKFVTENAWTSSDHSAHIEFFGTTTGTTSATTIMTLYGNGGLNLPAYGAGYALFDSSGTISSASAATAAQIWANTSGHPIDTAGAWSSAAATSLTDAATVAVDLSTGINFTVTLGGNRTLGNPSSTKTGQSGVIEIKQDATGSRTLAYSSNWKFAGGTAPVLTTTASARDMLFYYVVSSTVIYGSLVKDVK